MNLLLLSLLVGINLAYSILSLFIWKKNKKQKVYLYFSIFSFFSACYILLNSLSNLTDYKINGLTIICAGIYYAIFPWFIYEYVRVLKPKITTLLATIFLLAILFYFTNFNLFGIPFWQLLAHFGLIGLLLVAFDGYIILKKKNDDYSIYFLLIVLLFGFLAMEEIITSYTGSKFLSNYITGILPLDVFPIVFTLIVGKKLSTDIFLKSKFEIELSKSELKRKQLKIESLEKKVLEKKLKFKNTDLTTFGIEIAKNKKILQKTLEKLVAYKEQSNTNSVDFDEIIKFIKFQLRIDARSEVFHEKIESVNHEFLAKIKSEYPSLTENEINLVSLLKLKLSTKEIASIKNISPNSVKVLRSRLRKKLNLETTTNLIEFLSPID